MPQLREAAAPLTEAALDKIHDEKLRLQREDFQTKRKAPTLTEEQKQRQLAGLKRNGRKKGDLPSVAASRHMLRIGDLPSDCKDLARGLASLQLRLEQEVVANRKQVSVVDACCIQSIIEWESHRAKCLRWTKLNYDSMSLNDRRDFSREAAQAATMRNKQLRELGLTQSAFVDPWAALETEATKGVEVSDADSQ